MPLEIELKLAFPEDALPAILAHPLVAAAPAVGAPEDLESVYYDTPDLLLWQNRVALRLRKTRGGTIQTVKGGAPSKGGLTERPEWERLWNGQFDFSEVSEPAVQALLERELTTLAPAFVTRFLRETRRLKTSSGTEALLMIDIGKVAAGDRWESIREVEIELVSGVPADLFEVADLLRKTLPLTASDVSKAAMGYKIVLELRDA